MSALHHNYNLWLKVNYKYNFHIFNMNSFYIMAEKVYVLSHTDLDGYFSAGLVEHYYRLINPESEFTHKSWTYGRDLPSVNYIKNNFHKVFIVDLCPDFDFMYSVRNWERTISMSRALWNC